jgi:putative Holliday junction resolvase
VSVQEEGTGLRILALDFGTKRIGVAVSDELLITAQGLETIERLDPRRDLEAIKKVIADNGVTEVVVGLPINMNGTHSEKTREVIAFVDGLTKSIQVPVKMQDERLTTVQAERALLEGDMSRVKRKGLRDMLAAQFILQAYLAAKKREDTDARDQNA